MITIAATLRDPELRFRYCATTMKQGSVATRKIAVQQHFERGASENPSSHPSHQLLLPDGCPPQWSLGVDRFRASTALRQGAAFGAAPWA